MLEQEKIFYNNVNNYAIRVLEEVGVKITHKGLIELLENTGAAYYDDSIGRLIVLSDYTRYCQSIVPKKMSYEMDDSTVFGIGGFPGFFRKTGEDVIRQATKKEFMKIIKAVGDNTDVVKFMSEPCQVEKGFPAIECMRVMNDLPILKIGCSLYLDDKNAEYMSGRSDWHDSICLMNSPLIVMSDMADVMTRSARAGNILRLTTRPIAGQTGPFDLEGIMVLAHAETLFSLVVAQTLSPGIECIDGAMPGVGNSPDSACGGYLDNLVAIPQSRMNSVLDLLPSVHTCGSTEEDFLNKKALEESRWGRNMVRAYGIKMGRQSFGVLGGHKYFSLNKFIEDCKIERRDRIRFATPEKEIPFDIPKKNNLIGYEDKDVVDFIHEVEIDRGGKGKYPDYWFHPDTTLNIKYWDNFIEALRGKHNFK